MDTFGAPRARSEASALQQSSVFRARLARVARRADIPLWATAKSLDQGSHTQKVIGAKERATPGHLPKAIRRRKVRPGKGNRPKTIPVLVEVDPAAAEDGLDANQLDLAIEERVKRVRDPEACRHPLSAGCS